MGNKSSTPQAPPLQPPPPPPPPPAQEQENLIEDVMDVSGIFSAKDPVNEAIKIAQKKPRLVTKLWSTIFGQKKINPQFGRRRHKGTKKRTRTRTRTRRRTRRRSNRTKRVKSRTRSQRKKRRSYK
jgi:hypothetical protein